MIKQRSAGFIVFHRMEKIPSFLVLQYAYASRHWDFPRGGVEPGESDLDTAYREIEEETGLKDLQVIEGFSETSSWNFKHEGQLVFKEAIYFIAETKTKDIKLSSEHIQYRWLMADQVIRQLTFDNPRIVFAKARIFLKMHGIVN